MDSINVLTNSILSMIPYATVATFISIVIYLIFKCLFHTVDYFEKHAAIAHQLSYEKYVEAEKLILELENPIHNRECNLQQLKCYGELVRRLGKATMRRGDHERHLVSYMNELLERIATYKFIYLEDRNIGSWDLYWRLSNFFESDPVTYVPTND